MIQNSLGVNPYTDEVAFNSVSAGQPRVKSFLVDENFDVSSIEDAKAANAENNYSNQEDRIDEADLEIGFDREYRGTDEFVSSSRVEARRDGSGGGQQEQRRQPQRRIGKTSKSDSVDQQDEVSFKRERVFTLLDGLDGIWRTLADSVDEQENEFSNWNNWFKKERVKPPVPNNDQVFYVREEFNTRRSPHAWKSNPNRQWILTFGHTTVNNIVSTNLYKYQNDTIEKAA